MRNEFFGDDRDLFKWSHVLDLSEPDCQIIYVPMCRPDDRLSKRGIKCIRHDVSRFFRERRMESIEAITPRLHVPTWEMYEDSIREQYFQKVAAALDRSDLVTRRVIFLDPDTGMQPRNPNSKHVRNSSLHSLWQRMRRSDILAVYQHAPQNRSKDWVISKAVQFAEALAIPIGEVQRKPELDVCLYWSTKS